MFSIVGSRVNWSRDQYSGKSVLPQDWFQQQFRENACTAVLRMKVFTAPVSDLSRQQKDIRCLANLLNITFISQEQW